MEKQKGEMIDIKYRPAMIDKATMDLLLKQKERVGVIALYIFYNYTAIWQTTNTIRCTTKYAADGLNINRNRIIRYKKVLKELGLVEEIKRRKTNGDFGENYIKVNYYHTVSQCQDSARVMKRDTNTCSTNKRNACKSVVATKKESVDKLLKDRTISFDYKCAIILKEGFEKTKYQDRTTAASWSTKLQKVRLKYDIKKRHFKQIIKWYVSHYDDMFTPKLYGKNKGLVEKFPQIMDAFDRHLYDNNEIETIKITKTAKDIAKKLNKLDWHPKAKEQLLVAVQKSLTNYEPVYKAHLTLKNKKAFKGFCRVELSRFMYVPNDFVRIWFDNIYELTKDWDKWRGDLSSYVFNIDHKLFDDRGYELSRDWQHNRKAWTEYKTALKDGVIKDDK